MITDYIFSYKSFRCFEFWSRNFDIMLIISFSLIPVGYRLRKGASNQKSRLRTLKMRIFTPSMSAYSIGTLTTSLPSRPPFTHKRSSTAMGGSSMSVFLPFGMALENCGDACPPTTPQPRADCGNAVQHTRSLETATMFYVCRRACYVRTVLGTYVHTHYVRTYALRTKTRNGSDTTRYKCARID